MSDNYNFQAELKKAIFNCDERLDRKELLVDVFKTYVAKLFEMQLGKKGSERLEFAALVEIKRRLIDEFRQADLSEYQKSIEAYEMLFDETVQEILNDAALAHQGENIVQADPMKEFVINTRNYKGTSSGLLIPNK